MSTTPATIVSPPGRTEGYASGISDDDGAIWVRELSASACAVKVQDDCGRAEAWIPQADRLDLAAAIVGEMGTVIAHPDGLPELEIRTDRLGGHTWTDAWGARWPFVNAVTDAVLVAVLRARHAARGVQS